MSVTPTADAATSTSHAAAGRGMVRAWLERDRERVGGGPGVYRADTTRYYLLREVPLGNDGDFTFESLFGRFNAELAERSGYGTVDFNKPIVDLLKKGQLTDQTLSQQLIPDRIHPGQGAHVAMAWTLLQGWGATGMISTSNIDAGSGQTSGLNVKFRSVKTSTTSTAWDSLEGSLPFPFDRSEPTVDLALRVTNLDRAMNVQTVKVSGLRTGQYRLKIDGREIGKWTASDLNLGVNIGNLITPMADQADTVAKMTFERNVIQNTWWRDIKIRYEGLPGEGLPGAITGIQKLENDYLLLQRQAAQPKWHRFEVIKA
jgi:hypothetical protein